MKSRIIISGILAFSNPAAAITVHRVTSMADHGTGTLRAAVAAAASGDRITFAPWLYDKVIRLDSEITISKNLRIEGDINGDRRPDVTLDGQHKTRLLTIAVGANVTLWGMALEHAKASDGAAILNRGNITAQFCKINGNEASNVGGGIYSRGTVTIDHSSMRDNVANRGGAIFTAKLEASDAAKTTFSASTFDWNRAKATGGVIYNYSGEFKAYRSTFDNNRAQPEGDWEHATSAKGSVLYAEGGSSEFVDSTLKNNKSKPLTDPELKDCGFGIGKNRCNGCSCRPSAERKRNNKNRRVNNGGTIYNHGVLNNPQAVKLTRTVIADSRGRNCGGWGYFTLDHAWSDDDTCDGPTDYSHPGVSRGNAKLGVIADNGGYTYTFKPLSGSGLIDAGGSTCANSDQRGARRTEFMDPKCDIGAVETNAHPPSRLRPQSINTTPPAEHNEDNASLNSRIASLQIQVGAANATIAELNTAIDALYEHIAATIADSNEVQSGLRSQLADAQAQRAAAIERVASLEAQRAEHLARLRELDIRDDLQVEMGDAGQIVRLKLNDIDALQESETRVKVGVDTFRLGDTVTGPAHERPDGAAVSSGQFQGGNGIIYWTITSTVIPGTNWHVSRWEFNSPQAFGSVALSIYADLDIGQYTGHNGLIVGGTGHPNRLLVTDRTNPAEGVALGLRALKNASRMGWVGSPDIYHGRNGEILDPSILTGAYSGWGQFTPDQSRYPGGHGYGPADIAVAMGVMLKPSAKLASFETTIVGAPNEYIE
ncbi:choice-of-anchor Q domain-containing protein [Thiolapillus sp.]|uniref:choice-of-anchor Q domain-containing protein n=4 Tax=Thiolapillus sp. TaxID=2017437 RepID=UPI003AF88268